MNISEHVCKLRNWLEFKNYAVQSTKNANFWKIDLPKKYPTYLQKRGF